MDYPIKYLVIIDGVVIGYAILYYPNSTYTGPEGSTVIEVPEADERTTGWRYIYNEDEEKYYWLPPLPAQTLQAGNGNPPPPG